MLSLFYKLIKFLAPWVISAVVGYYLLKFFMREWAPYFAQNDMTHGLFVMLFAALFVAGGWVLWTLFCNKNKENKWGKKEWWSLAIVVPLLTFYGLWTLAPKDIYGGSTTKFDKFKRSVYWMTPNFEIPYHATLIADGAFADCDMLKSVEISNRVKTIGKCAFENCVRLEKVVIGNRVASIGDSAFYNCGSLKDVKMGTAVISIDRGAFANCHSLESVTIPSYVASIGDGAFFDCTSLTTVYCKAVTPPKLGGRSVFAYDAGDVSKHLKCTIYVPNESVKAYQTAEVWSEYADRIVGYDF